MPGCRFRTVRKEETDAPCHIAYHGPCHDEAKASKSQALTCGDFWISSTPSLSRRVSRSSRGNTSSSGHAVEPPTRADDDAVRSCPAPSVRTTGGSRWKRWAQKGGASWSAQIGFGIWTDCQGRKIKKCAFGVEPEKTGSSRSSRSCTHLLEHGLRLARRIPDT